MRLGRRGRVGMGWWMMGSLRSEFVDDDESDLAMGCEPVERVSWSSDMMDALDLKGRMWTQSCDGGAKRVRRLVGNRRDDGKTNVDLVEMDRFGSI